MDDLTHTQEPTETPLQPEAHSSSESGFEEALREQNINTMIEIYGEEYAEKLDRLTK
ncbi:MAG: hypothetical protein HOI59_00495 [Nitrospina sp.]|jgi:hypothetical protein|nr:hypothetical protein [Nitrospina sp.]MBT3414429.1 hypothetical protein [Nitrospina sp.]MBT3855749.1 hypothetical protein [Nitrospina sp.]MBT4105055.1 hypothetical protein [Nitrospina sp.]MBT4390215.1 hypothetical protein [Nitrospina sp.]